MLRTSCQRELIKEKAPLSQGTHINMETFVNILQDVFSKQARQNRSNEIFLRLRKYMQVFFTLMLLLAIFYHVNRLQPQHQEP